MSESSTRRSSQKRTKPPKVRPKFPLTAHPSGRWTLKRRGRNFYFGRWDDPAAKPSDAEALWYRFREKIEAGEITSVRDALRQEEEAELLGTGVLTLADLFDDFLSDCKERVEAGELQHSTLEDYQRTCQKIADVLGKRTPVESLAPDDFRRLKRSVQRTACPVTLSGFIVRARIPFKWALDNDLIDSPVRYGTQFNKPKQDKIRKHLSEQAEKFFEPAELRALIDAATQPMRSMLLLGINAALGNRDIGMLPVHRLELPEGMLRFPRPKTGMERFVTLWPETISALEEWMRQRPKPKKREHDEYVFVTKYGGAWFTENGKDNPVSKEFGKLAKSLGLHRRGRGFYSLRHTFRTVADNSIDLAAVQLIMGHSLGGMSDVYVRRNRIDVERVRAVTDHVHDWLFAEGSDDE